MVENISYLESLLPEGETGEAGPSLDAADIFRKNGQQKHLPDTIPDRGTQQPGGESVGEKIRSLIHHHRAHGHRLAKIDPLGASGSGPPELGLEHYHFSPDDLDELVSLPTLHLEEPLTVREIFERLQKIYCGPIGVEFMQLDNPAREWLQMRLENQPQRASLSREEKLVVLTRLAAAGMFEEFLRKKFPGAKTFSLEGLEMLVPLLDCVFEKSAAHGVRDVVIGMAHRGRLNVLTHIACKPVHNIFREFAGTNLGSENVHGDVKYHLGYSGDYITEEGKTIHVSLCFNPSHLEFVNPIVLGRTRARQDRANDSGRCESLSLLIHGDAAFAGEGVVPETLNLSRLAGYFGGGTIHIILNNQIGFTTSPGEARSTAYATDVAHLLRAPIFHVNGEDAEAVTRVTRLAVEFREMFKTDVFIDVYGYRRFGHNETDEPSFTQPVMYREIAGRKAVRENYFAELKKSGDATDEDYKNITDSILKKLEAEFDASLPDATGKNGSVKSSPPGIWKNYAGGAEPRDETGTALAPEKISGLLQKLSQVPETFHLHPKLERMLKLRREMAEGRLPLDWAAAELLALASLATENVRIRLSGQDSARGTFSHRHAIFYDHENGSPFSPLQHLATGQAPVEIVNSPLSEAAALGFEYGYSLDCPGGLILWEAQFGDFVNAAQVILDQFLSSAEDKWQRLSGLVLLLPHGFEGMGAEHSSARLERFLALAAEDNIQIAQPTTPAQYFHLLRRQALRNWRKPLVVLTPKSLLRHPQVVSDAKEFSEGNFQRILPDVSPNPDAKRILICTGKIYYELLAFRAEHKREDVALVRMEQLYPLRNDLLEAALRPFAKNIPVFWVQEEPVNMGAWRFLHEKFGRKILGRQFDVVSRPESASPATGSARAHKLEQEELIRLAFGESDTGAKVELPATAASPKTQEE